MSLDGYIATHDNGLEFLSLVEEETFTVLVKFPVISVETSPFNKISFIPGKLKTGISSDPFHFSHEFPLFNEYSGFEIPKGIMSLIISKLELLGPLLITDNV